MRRRLRIGLCCLLLLTTAVAAELTPLQFETDPSGAEIRDQYGNSLGHSGESLQLDLSPYGSTLEVTFLREGYEPKLERVKTRQLKEQGRYPQQGAIALRSKGMLISLKTFVAKHQAATASLVLAVVVGSGFMMRRRTRTLVQLDRAAVLEQAKVQAELHNDNLIGCQLGAYRLMDLLGEGGAAKVYRALPDESLDESEAVAVKVLRPEAGDDQEFEARFRREVNIWKTLSHPHIVTFVDWDRSEGTTYLVMELIEGETLRPQFSKGARSPQEALDVLRPVFQGVAHAHKMGVCHRDLKPENVLLTKSGKCKVTDFGLARVGTEDKITKTGTWVGTPEYMSPEQVRGLGVDTRTDQYALGIMLYELVHGEPPFTGEDQVALIFKQVTGKAVPLATLHPDVPEEFSQAVVRMLAKKPEDRFSDLESALAALEVSLG